VDEHMAKDKDLQRSVATLTAMSLCCMLRDGRVDLREWECIYQGRNAKLGTVGDVCKGLCCYTTRTIGVFVLLSHYPFSRHAPIALFVNR
jgi:hypothetical protein